jgi:hypothetical protein
MALRFCRWVACNILARWQLTTGAPRAQHLLARFHESLDPRGPPLGLPLPSTASYRGNGRGFRVARTLTP